EHPPPSSAAARRGARPSQTELRADSGIGISVALAGPRGRWRQRGGAPAGGARASEGPAGRRLDGLGDPTADAGGVDVEQGVAVLPGQRLARGDVDVLAVGVVADVEGAAILVAERGSLLPVGQQRELPLRATVGAPLVDVVG